MIPAMPATALTSRQASVAALRFGQLASMGAVTVLILIAGVWASWGSAQYVMLTKGRERGTIEVERCAQDACSGPYTPLSHGSQARGRVVIEKTVAVRKGRTYTMVVAGGMRRTRLAWVLAGSGIALLTAAFVTI
jgi:hypothetical protein